MPDSRFEIVFVCHANICRSPMAERLARKAFGPRITITSAGTHAWHGGQMHAYTEQVLTERGADAAEFASRPLTARIVAEADLILAAGREQRAACVTLAPAAVRRTFTLRQFGRLVALAGPTSANPTGGELTALVGRVRSVIAQPVGRDEDDLADPVGGPVDAFRACADEIQRVLNIIVRS